MIMQGGEMKANDFGWRRVPLGVRMLAIIEPDGRIEVLPDFLTTAEAAVLLKCSIRKVQAMCDEGVLVEGREWLKTCTRGGRGDYRISRDGLLRVNSGVH